MHGAVERIRTSDLLITSELLYQLSYNGNGGQERQALAPEALRIVSVPPACDKGLVSWLPESSGYRLVTPGCAFYLEQ